MDLYTIFFIRFKIHILSHFDDHNASHLLIKEVISFNISDIGINHVDT